MVKGKAVFEKTQEYLNTHSIKSKNCNNVFEVSSIGLGTYLGTPNSTIDKAYKEAVEYALLNGINVIDAAINYRGMRSEVLIGEVITKLINENKIDRESLVLASKGGFPPADYRNSELDDDFRETHFEKVKNTFYELFASKIQLPKEKIDEISQRGNTVEKEVIEVFFEQSRENLNLESLDIYYLHNPESSKAKMDEELFYDELLKTFKFLEKMVEEGKLGYYGLSTSMGFLVDSCEKGYLDLNRISGLAKEAGGEDNHFKFIQLPLNLGFKDAAEKLNHLYNGEKISTVDLCQKLGLSLFTNVSLGQGRFFDKFTPKQMLEYLIDNEKISSSMVGMKSVSNVERNLVLLKK